MDKSAVDAKSSWIGHILNIVREILLNYKLQSCQGWDAVVTLSEG